MQSSALIDGKYQLVRPLGSGGMGSVYEGKHVGTGRRVAVKVVSPDALAKGPDVAERFRREAMASGEIESQYIAHVVDTGIDVSGAPYIVMELLVGEDLKSALKRLRRLTPDLALRVAAQACMGLQKAHEVGVIHRDVKPANLFLTRRDEDIVVKLLDFGIAKVRLEPLAAADADRTGSGVMLGSPLYMSPEQARGKKSIDHRSDVFSLGVVLYEMLTGKPPHAKADTIGDLIVRICGEEARPVHEVAPSVTTPISGIVQKALAIDPSGRFASAAEMLAAIRSLIPGPLTLDAKALAIPDLPPMRAPAGSRSVLPGPGLVTTDAKPPSEPLESATIAHTPSSKSDVNKEISTGSGNRTKPPPKAVPTPRPSTKQVQAKEPKQKRIFVQGAKRAAVLLWGEEGLNQIAGALDDDTRAEFFRTASTQEMIDCKHVINWCFTAWEGPAKQSKPKMTEYVDRIFDFSFGVVRRAVLRFADPAAVVPRLPAFWKEDYSTGELTAVLEPDGKSATIHILDHPFSETPHARASIAESYRYAFSQTRAKDVKESHGLVRPGVMMFRLRWT